jgi:SHS2 domain-containing protein
MDAGVGECVKEGMNEDRVGKEETKTSPGQCVEGGPSGPCTKAARADSGREASNREVNGGGFDSDMCQEGAGNIKKALLDRVQGELFEEVRSPFSQQFEYLDHTADVQLHAWGSSLREAFEQVALCMFNYMTPLEGIERGLREKLCAENDRCRLILKDCMRVFRIQGASDIESLMFQWLDELLFGFSTEFFVPVRIRIVGLERGDSGGGKGFGITAVAVGDLFDSAVHACGTEIKAITYSAMQILDVNEREQKGADGRADVYVIVDI